MNELFKKDDWVDSTFLKLNVRFFLQHCDIFPGSPFIWKIMNVTVGSDYEIIRKTTISLRTGQERGRGGHSQPLWVRLSPRPAEVGAVASLESTAGQARQPQLSAAWTLHRDTSNSGAVKTEWNTHKVGHKSGPGGQWWLKPIVMLSWSRKTWHGAVLCGVKMGQV